MFQEQTVSTSSSPAAAVTDSSRAEHIRGIIEANRSDRLVTLADGAYVNFVGFTDSEQRQILSALSARDSKGQALWIERHYSSLKDHLSALRADERTSAADVTEVVRVHPIEISFVKREDGKITYRVTNVLDPSERNSSRTRVFDGSITSLALNCALVSQHARDVIRDTTTSFSEFLCEGGGETLGTNARVDLSRPIDPSELTRLEKLLTRGELVIRYQPTGESITGDVRKLFLSAADLPALRQGRIVVPGRVAGVLYEGAATRTEADRALNGSEPSSLRGEVRTGYEIVAEMGNEPRVLVNWLDNQWLVRNSAGEYAITLNGLEGDSPLRTVVEHAPSSSVPLPASRHGIQPAYDIAIPESSLSLNQLSPSLQNRVREFGRGVRDAELLFGLPEKTLVGHLVIDSQYGSEQAYVAPTAPWAPGVTLEALRFGRVNDLRAVGFHEGNHVFYVMTAEYLPEPSAIERFHSYLTQRDQSFFQAINESAFRPTIGAIGGHAESNALELRSSLLNDLLSPSFKASAQKLSARHRNLMLSAICAYREDLNLLKEEGVVKEDAPVYGILRQREQQLAALGARAVQWDSAPKAEARE